MQGHSNTEAIEINLSKRKNAKFSKLFSPHTPTQEEVILWAHSSDDNGVWRNGGRRGARFAPQAITACFAQMNAEHLKLNQPIMTYDIENKNSQTEYSQNFDFAQKESINSFKKLIDLTPKAKSLIHLGGGHDHVYPLLSAINSLYPHHPIGVINIDAHLDTRTDEVKHSGTPFRQFANQMAKSYKNTSIQASPFHLIQVGIHDYANALSNFKKMDYVTMQVVPQNKSQCPQEMSELCLKYIKQSNVYFDKHFSDHCPIWILSIDADGLDSSIMEAVSAVNHHGLTRSQINQIVDIYKKECLPETKIDIPQILGIYEYNPIYDNLSQKGARSLSSIIYQFLFE